MAIIYADRAVCRVIDADDGKEPAPSGISSNAAGTFGRRRLPGLDVLRGIAIALVILRHARPQFFGGSGIVGVTLFFTLSGYLITNVLLRDMVRIRQIDWRRFYRNRALRLLPALVGMLVIGLGVAGILSTDITLSVQLRSGLVGIFYVSNLPWITHGTAPMIGHLWTLATEEQFYLIWPWVLAWSVRRGRLRSTVLTLSILAIVLSAGLAVIFRERPVVLYKLPTTWVLTLLLGALAAILHDTLAPRVSCACAVVAALVLAALCFPQLKIHAITYVVAPFVIGTCGAALCLWAATFGELSGLFGPLRWLGKISYAAYLWNFPFANWFEDQLTGRPWWVIGALEVGATLLAAQVSWMLVEYPIAQWRRRHDRAKRPAPAGASAG